MKSLVISENFYHLMSLLNIEVAKMVIRDAGFLLSRVSMQCMQIARYCFNNSVCLCVRLSVCLFNAGMYPNEWTYRLTF